MSGDLASLVSSLGTTYTLARALVGERDAQKQATIKAELTERILDGQAKLSEAIALAFQKDATIHELRQRVQDLEAQQAEKDRYRLAKVGSEGEFLAYKLRSPGDLVERSDEIEHFLCQPCFDHGRKVVLTSNGEGYWYCPVCKHGAQVAPVQSVEFEDRRDNYF